MLGVILRGRSRPRRLPVSLLLLPVLIPGWTGCYTQSATRSAERIVRAGSDWEEIGPWVVVSAPGSVIVAAGDLAVGSVVPLHEGETGREPEHKWFRAYPGAMRAGEEVAIVCHTERSTWISAIRPAGAPDWTEARHRRWHFPMCVEALPGDWELEVHYFARESMGDREHEVARQAESIEPSVVTWRAAPGTVYLLSARLGPTEPSRASPPQRHIPRSRALGTTWWELEESDWTAEIEFASRWENLEGPVVEARKRWKDYDPGP